MMLVRVPYDRAADRVAIVLAQKMATLPEFFRNSITWDQGKEMAAHARFTVATGIPVSSATRTAPGSGAATRTL